MTLSEFKTLPKDVQYHCMEELLPILSHTISHMISIDEVYIMLEVITPLIEQKCLLGDNLRDYLNKKLSE